LNLIDKAVPDYLGVHVVLDNSSTHKTPSTQRWLVRQPRSTFHLTPTYSSWMNLVERWFAELTTKWIKRATHLSVRELVKSIRTWIAGWNDDPKPYVWHKTADEISIVSPPTARGSAIQNTSGPDAVTALEIEPEPAAASPHDTHVVSRGLGEEPVDQVWRARRDSNPQPSDP
jgi:hypothetical protein